MSKECSELVWDSGGWRQSHCMKSATVERDGKWYCGIHDPLKVQERNDKKHQAYLSRCCPCGIELKSYWHYCPYCGLKKGATK
jgi:hypothetical protein